MNKGKKKSGASVEIENCLFFRRENIQTVKP